MVNRSVVGCGNPHATAYILEIQHKIGSDIIKTANCRGVIVFGNFVYDGSVFFLVLLQHFQKILTNAEQIADCQRIYLGMISELRLVQNFGFIILVVFVQNYSFKCVKCVKFFHFKAPLIENKPPINSAVNYILIQTANSVKQIICEQNVYIMYINIHGSVLLQADRSAVNRHKPQYMGAVFVQNRLYGKERKNHIENPRKH